MPFKKTAAHAPGLISAPRIVSATPDVYQVGILLTCVPGVYTNNPLTRTYQWKLDGVGIGVFTTSWLPYAPGVVTCVETVTNTKGHLITSSLPVTVTAATAAPIDPGASALAIQGLQGIEQQ